MSGRGGWNRGKKTPAKYLVVSQDGLDKLQPRDIGALKESVQLCRDLTLEGRGTHLVIKVVKTLTLDDVTKKQPVRDRDKYPWNQLRQNASFVYKGSYTSATVACKAARVRLRPKVFKAFVVYADSSFQVMKVVVRRLA
jgi:hypothetical protein